MKKKSFATISIQCMVSHLFGEDDYGKVYSGEITEKIEIAEITGHHTL